MKALALAALLTAPAAAVPVVESGAYLNIGVGARALGLGGAYTALGDDASAVYWNPAGLASVEKREASASHAELTQSTRHDFLAYAHPTSLGTFAGAFTYLSQGSLDGRDAAGRPTGGFNASDAALAGAWGYHGELLDFGAAFKYLRSHIGSAEAQTVAGDAGLRKAFGSLIVGAALRNVGPGLKYDQETDDLPMRLAVGAAYKVPGGHAVAAEWTSAPRRGGSDAGLGGEYQALKGVFLRLGYATQSAIAGGSSFDAARGLTLGVGLKKERWSLDYAAAPSGELGAAHRFSVAWRW